MSKVIQEAEIGSIYSRATLKNPPLAPPFVRRPGRTAKGAGVKKKISSLWHSTTPFRYGTPG
jgi:hypothetical protein